MVKPRIFSSGQTCAGTYTILSLCERSPAAESYVARHRRTREEVILTCSRLDHGDDGARLRSTFVEKAAKLKALSIENAPKILGAGVSDGVYWIAREQLHGAIPLSKIFSGNNGERIYDGWKKVYPRAPLFVRAVVAMHVARDVSSILSSFAARGVFHGGLDPARNIVVSEDGDVAVLEVGYHVLFGAEHFPISDELRMVQAPERPIDLQPDEPGDIYSLGVILSRVLAKGACEGPAGPSRYVAGVLVRMTRERLEHRIQRWREINEAMGIILEEYTALAERAAEQLGPVKNDATLNAEESSAGPDPQSGLRDRTSDDEVVTEQAAPPASTTGYVEEPAPPTALSSTYAPPTPRVPEKPAGAHASFDSAVAAEAVVDASSNGSVRVEPTPVDLPSERASSSNRSVVMAHVRLMYPVESTSQPVSRNFRPASRRHNRANGPPWRWLAAVGVVAGAVLLIVSHRVVTTRAAGVPKAMSALHTATIGANRLQTLELSSEQTSVGPRVPAPRQEPSGQHSRRASVWNACEDFVLCTARRSSGLRL